MKAVVTVWMLAGGCAPALPPASLQAPTDDPGRVLISEYGQDVGRTWTRSPAPDRNASFLTIEGTAFYRIGPGDVLDLGYQTAAGPVTVSLEVAPDGTLQLPGLLGSERVNVGELALPQAIHRITATLARVLRSPQISLSVRTYRSSMVTVLGAGVVSGDVSGTRGRRVPLQGRTRISELVFSTVSDTDEGDLTAVLVTDTEGRTGLFDLDAAIYRDRPDQDPVLDAGDVVTIPSTSQTQSRIYVLGEVSQPAILVARPGMRVLDAVMSAGGPNQRANTNYVTLVRGRGSEATAHKIAWDRIVRQGGGAWNVVVEPGDIVYVGRSGYDSAIQFFRDTWAVLQNAVLVGLLVERF